MRFIAVPLTWMLLCLGAMFLLRHAWPVIIFLHAPWTYLGLIPLLAGVLLIAAGTIGLLRKHTTVEPFHQPARLVTGGVYGWSRNPIYLGYTMILVGVWVMVGDLSAGLAVLAFIAVADRVYIRFEEKMLARTFGQAFDDYRRNTRRWI